MNATLSKMARAAGAIPLRILDAFSIAALAAMLIVMVAEIVYRQVFGKSLEITEEVAAYCLTVLVFLRIPSLMLRDELLRVDLVYANIGPRLRRGFNIIFSALSVGVAGVYVVQIWRLVTSSYMRGNKTTTVLETPVFIPQSVMLIGFCALFAVTVVVFWRYCFTSAPAEKE